MKRLIVVALLGSLLLVLPTAADTPRDAEAIWKEYQAIKMPALDREKVNDLGYIREYSEARRQAADKQNELALEFYKAAPNDKRALQLMVLRWRYMAIGDREQAEKEIAEFVEKATDPEVKATVLYQRALMAVNTARPDLAKGQEEAEAFIKAYPKDERGASLLTMLAMHSSGASARQLYERIIIDYPDSRAAKMAGGHLRRADGVGKPFKLEFTDAMTGQPVSIAALHGKVVVVDFWATWCGPCVAEMPKMKELYSKYKDQGVEFIGISLDQPGEGLTALKKFVTDNEIAWPQYYQGDGWDSQFSQSWGVNSIPALFVVDAEGHLASTEARGGLDSIIAELIKKRDENKAG
jgi:thiol-disulfide isomerase/thioredoxin/TolA-binding protein